MLKVESPLPLFTMGNVAGEYVACVLVEVETEAEKVLGSFRPKEYDALCTTNIPNGGRLNMVLKQMGVPHAPRPLPGSVASQTAIKKQKAEVSKRSAVKKSESWFEPSCAVQSGAASA
jgi:hypothetical protein